MDNNKSNMLFKLLIVLLNTFFVVAYSSFQESDAALIFKIWAIGFNVDPNAGNISACTFATTVTAVKCEYFDLSQLFLSKGKPNFVIGPVPVSLEAPPPADMQMCLEAQQEAGTNAKPGDWLFQCKPVIKDSKGFFVARFDLKGMSRNNTSQNVVGEDNGNMTGGCIGEQCNNYEIPTGKLGGNMTGGCMNDKCN